MKKAFHTIPRREWSEIISGWGQPRFRADQIADWIFKRHASRIDELSNISKDLRQRLEAEFDWQLPTIADRLESDDGSTKLLLASKSGQFIESVILRYDNRTSLCVSSQVGCKLACSFCQTGKLGFFRHLSTAEIVAQLVIANSIVKGEGRQVTHVVFMGMGEPLDNYENAVAAANLMISPDEFGLSYRRVTISTSGIAPRVIDLARDSRATLAVSLHAARAELRSELMPINTKYPLPDLKAALLEYQKQTGQTITIEYILIKDKNCGLREAKELVNFLHGLRAKVNLIPFNPHPGMPYERPSAEAIRSFQKYLAERSYPAPVRYSKGLSVSAACGQLAAKNIATLAAIPNRKAALVAPPLTTLQSPNL